MERDADVPRRALPAGTRPRLARGGARTTPERPPRGCVSRLDLRSVRRIVLLPVRGPERRAGPRRQRGRRRAVRADRGGDGTCRRAIGSLSAKEIQHEALHRIDPRVGGGGRLRRREPGSQRQRARRPARGRAHLHEVVRPRLPEHGRRRRRRYRRQVRRSGPRTDLAPMASPPTSRRSTSSISADPAQSFTAHVEGVSDNPDAARPCSTAASWTGI